MFMVSDEEAELIQTAYHRGGELAAVAELRRVFPVFQGNERAVDAVRMIAGWRRVQVAGAVARRSPRASRDPA
ncbi:hypothetical protein HL658_16055 [Azospirillum sp. RWY-5-1]|uniref:Uncharacterized protein n=1 Tax=Azospirillum oleiclasticum TaxID=2735135 RepID=A0ABX2TBB4_9PROT|nr:hypothetical protein [Azospirillum oleiclasticum]NYZ21553.1 hypothetical protein [Azospirillum oleiclasticum]